MLMKDIRRGCLLVGTVCALAWLSLRFRLGGDGPAPDPVRWKASSGSPGAPSAVDTAAAAAATADDDDLTTSHRELVSLTNPSGRFFPLDFLSIPVMNPNILPHPTLPHHYLLVGQIDGGAVPKPFAHVIFTEVFCIATFANTTAAASTTLRCLEEPQALPVAPDIPIVEDRCPDNLKILALGSGPHDARVFHGPGGPLVVYGGNSAVTCFGLWAHDLRGLVPLPWDAADASSAAQAKPAILADQALAVPFRKATELRRPPPVRPLEKNYFLFWDLHGRLYAHYDVFPSRAFAAVDAVTGLVEGDDLGGTSPARGRDEACLARYLPRLPARREGSTDSEDVHQDTNSLLVTLCRRADAGCDARVDNTVVVALVQHKLFYNLHGAYEPYAVAFWPRPPFAMYGVSARPLLVRGRGATGVAGQDGKTRGARDEMLYVVSMAWKDPGRRWHGYLDDVVFVAFGIEDRASGAIDVRMEDLLGELGVCEEG